jgi:hypothetical protein
MHGVSLHCEGAELPDDVDLPQVAEALLDVSKSLLDVSKTKLLNPSAFAPPALGIQEDATMLGIGAYKQRMPRPDEALPGRATEMPLHNVHHVLGSPLRDAFAGFASRAAYQQRLRDAGYG